MSTNETEDPAQKKEAGVWKRPVAQQKDSQVKTWLIFLGVLLIAFSLWVPVRALWSRYRYTRPVASVQRTAESFVALAYHGVSEEASKPESMDIQPAAFEAQISALTAKGYTPIGLEDVTAFYQEGKLLPEKAVLLTFEQTRKSTYFEARSVLRKYRWRAVMGVWTEPMHAEDEQALRWPYLRDMFTLGIWDLVAESREGFHYIPAGPEGATGPFLTTPMWLEQNKRYELPEEFATRLQTDHQEVIQEFKKEMGVAPVAFFYPYGDYGQYDEMAKVVRTINLQQVGTNYHLGFTLGTLALNTRYSDTARLNRLLVDPKWTPQELVDRLERVWPFSQDDAYRIRNFDSQYWIKEWGDVASVDGALRVRAIPQADPLEVDQRKATTGAKAWLLGSDLLQDGFVSMRFQLKSGRFALYMRSSPRGEYIVFTLDGHGNVSLRQKTNLETEVMLATDSSLNEPRSDHELLLGLRGNMAYVRLNNRLLFGGRVLLQGAPVPGLIGVGVWDEVSGIGDLSIVSTKLVAPERAVVTWTPEIGRNPAHVSAWLQENSYRYTILSPPWMDVQSTASFTLPLWDREALLMLARLNCFKICPAMTVRDAQYLKRLSVDEVVKDMEAFQVDGLYVDARGCDPSQIASLSDWLLKLNAHFVKKNYQLLLRLPTAVEGMPSAGNMINTLAGVVLAGEFSRPLFGLPWEKLIGTLSIDPEAKESPLSLYYQIVEKQGQELSPDARAEVLRQKGFDAFVLGEYERAIECWTDWSTLKPQTSDPLSLIGDAYLRLNRLTDALEAYTKSLQLNPGQVELAIRRARLLEKMGRSDEQAAMLNLYARVFPGTSSLVIEQSKWLLTNKRKTEATELMKKLVKERPEELEARQILQGMLEEPGERYQNLKDLLDHVKSGSASLHGLGRVLTSSDLLSTRESAVFFSAIREAALQEPRRQTRELFSGFLPLERIVSEQFQQGVLSDHWTSFGSSVTPNSSGRFELRAGSDMAEAYLRLRKSDFLRDGFIEVDLDESVGFFWLYARRSSSAMIRFGFDDEGFLRIQSWVNGELRTSENRGWMRPPGLVNMRLEVRGDGARGFVNGSPAFATSLTIPNDLRYGWWSVAPFSTELGMARAKIGRITAAPLPTTILMVPPMDEMQVPQFLDRTRPAAYQISAVAPIVYFQKQDGSIEENKAFSMQMLRMFVSFHRLRFMPVVEASYFSELDVPGLMALLKRDNITSLCVCTRFMPSEAWFKAVEAELEKTSAYLLVMVSEKPFWTEVKEGREVKEKTEEPVRLATLRQIERGNLLLPPLRSVWPSVEAHTFTEEGIPSPLPFAVPAEMEALSAREALPELNQPRLYVYPSEPPVDRRDIPHVEMLPPREEVGRTLHNRDGL